MAKRNTTSPEIDQIGGLAPLTQDEQQMISKYLASKKGKSAKDKPRSAQHRLAKSLQSSK
jgi:hypothetical protein